MGAARIAKNLSSLSRLPISIVEFENALAKIWNVPQSMGHEEKGSTIVGLAISGGVDSMALAVLCSHLQVHPTRASVTSQKEDASQIFLSNLKFQAFVVDHSMRVGSDKEAANVSKILEQRGIPTEILKIQWPQSQNPNIAPNFESLARNYRFRLLGKACKYAGINSLLLAHHEDDQAETIMMRLVSGHRMGGLAGIKSKASIPECYGLHGIHESGGRDKSFLLDNCPSQELHLPPNLSQPHYRYEGQPILETGGIKIYRPLLGFSKLRLISTCQIEGMPWFEDHTNKNPTVTKRNAIRHIFSNFSLPTSLMKPRLLSMARAMAEKGEVQSQLLKPWLAGCKITSFDTSVGTLTLNFPDLTKSLDISKRLNVNSGELAAHLLRRIIMLVSPEERVELSSLHSAVAHIFPEIIPVDHPKRMPKAFTVCGVLFQNLPNQYEFPRTHQWFLCRQPYNSGVTKKPLLYFLPTSGDWSPWELYDGRYWIRVQNLGREDVLVRPFHENDKKKLEKSVLGGDSRLQRILKQRAPGNVRWTLPVITVREGNGSERVLDLLTLRESKPFHTIKWQVRYKKVDMDNMTIVKTKKVSSMS